MANEPVCELECRGLQGLPATREFVGPVKIILIDSTPVDYRRRVCVSAMIALLLLLWGVPVFTLILYTMKFRLPIWVNLHIVLGTLAVQMFMVPGILTLSKAFGGTMFLTPRSRKFQHLLLQSFAVGCGLATLVLMLRHLQCSSHDVLGFFGVILSACAGLFGPCLYVTSPTGFFGRVTRKIHLLFGIPSFVCSSVCYATCFAEPKFVEWLGDNSYVGVLTIINLFCFVTVLVSIFIKIKDDSE